MTAIPVVACPLLFFVLFKVTFTLNGYHYPLHGDDLIATRVAEAAFVNEVLWLTFSGLVIGVLCGLVIRYLYRRIPRHVI